MSASRRSPDGRARPPPGQRGRRGSGSRPVARGFPAGESGTAAPDTAGQSGTPARARCRGCGASPPGCFCGTLRRAGRRPCWGTGSSQPASPPGHRGIPAPTSPPGHRGIPTRVFLLGRRDIPAQLPPPRHWFIFTRVFSPGHQSVLTEHPAGALGHPSQHLRWGTCSVPTRAPCQCAGHPSQAIPAWGLCCGTGTTLPPARLSEHTSQHPHKGTKGVTAWAFARASSRALGTSWHRLSESV